MALVWTSGGWRPLLGAPTQLPPASIPPAWYPHELAQIVLDPSLALTMPARIGLPPRKSIFGKVIGRIVRYTALAGTIWGLGYLAGYYLTLAKAAAFTALVGISGGIRATVLVAEDLARLGIEREWIRGGIAGRVGVLFGSLAWIGGAVGLYTYGLHKVVEPAREALRRAWIRPRPLGGSGLGGGGTIWGF